MTEVLCVRMDEGHRGQLATFQNASWSGRKAFEALSKPYVLKGFREFPVCRLDSREKGDGYGNHAPVFTVLDWMARESFPDLLPPETDALPAPASPDTAALAPTAATAPAAPLPRRP